MSDTDQGKLFNKGDIVWAKVRGYPWWPAKFVDYDERKGSEEPQAIVNFIGDNSHAFLSLPKVVPYTPHRAEFAKAKRKGLPEAVQAADRLVEKGPKILLCAENAGEVQSPIHEARKRPFPDRKVVMESSEEDEGDEIEGVDDAKGLIAQLVIAKDAELAVQQKESLIEALEIIKEEVKDHGTILKTGVGAYLKRFVEIYGKEPRLGKVVDSSKTCLAGLEKVVLEAYFGGPEELPTAGETQQQKHKRLKRSAEDTDHQSAAHKENNKVKSPQIKLEPESSHEEAEADTDTVPPKDHALMISVCQEIAKLIEEVPFLWFDFENFSRHQINRRRR